MSTELKIPNFDSIEVSTKTFIVLTNLTLDTVKIFSDLDVSPYVLLPKKRGRKKKNIIEDPNKNIPDGSIISLQLGNGSRGVCIKKKSKNTKPDSLKYFRNALTVIMIIDKKMLNFKISRNGKFQMTGCKYTSQAEKCIGSFLR
jgi:hypothetical protein